MSSWKLERALDLIEREGRTRKWLAEYCRINPLSLNHYLSGRRTPAAPLIKLMAMALNTTEGYLMGEDANLHPPPVEKRAVGS